MGRRFELSLLMGIVALAACSTSAEFPPGAGVTGTPTGTPTPSIVLPTPTPIVILAPFTASGSPVNKCFRIANAPSVGNVLELDTPSASALDLPKGTRLLLWQVLDVGATTGNTTPIVTAGQAGHFQIVVVESATPNSINSVIVLTNTLNEIQYSSALASTAGRRAQACTFPIYQEVVIPAAINLPPQNPWNGFTGGFVGFEANLLTLDGTIFANGAGFRGGARNVAGLTGGADGSIGLDVDETLGGGKGEGLDGRSYSVPGLPSSIWGRGNYWNAGGGGNQRNAGGGGGGNGGRGGFGGQQFSGNSPGDTGGIGGAAIAVPVASFLSMGGGGGAGHDDSDLGGAGGQGGGLVIVFANSIQLSSSGVITARGINGAPSPDGQPSDGAGGGGAGGTIWLRAPSVPGTVSLFLDGGDGGATFDSSMTSVVGPGGGGAGGRLYAVTASSQPITVIHNDTGGNSGLHNGTDAWGAEPGLPLVSSP